MLQKCQKVLAMAPSTRDPRLTLTAIPSGDSVEALATQAKL
jgi:hypothetical protein